MRRGVQRNQRVARSGPDALADSIETYYGDEPSPCASGGEEKQLADRGESVARKSYFLMALRTVGCEPCGEADKDHRQPVVHPVYYPVLQWAQVKMENQINRQDAIDHLG